MIKIIIKYGTPKECVLSRNDKIFEIERIGVNESILIYLVDWSCIMNMVERDGCSYIEIDFDNDTRQFQFCCLMINVLF